VKFAHAFREEYSATRSRNLDRHSPDRFPKSMTSAGESSSARRQSDSADPQEATMKPEWRRKAPLNSCDWVWLESATRTRTTSPFSRTETAIRFPER
jgi:hypothetical protein